jgi:hypothetical protein
VCVCVCVCVCGNGHAVCGGQEEVGGHLS